MKYYIICIIGFLFALPVDGRGQTLKDIKVDTAAQRTTLTFSLALPADTAAYTIGEVPDLPKEQVLDSILARHRGDVLFVDFWYVYCRSCKKAYAEMEPLHREFMQKGVKFLFVTGDKASPLNRWLPMIKTMPGIHYRVTNETYRYLIDEHFRMAGLPYYLIVDRRGNIVYRHAGFEGCDKIREILQQQLNK